MDSKLINAYKSVIEDMQYDTLHSEEYRGVLLNILKHRMWELENFDEFETVEEA